MEPLWRTGAPQPDETSAAATERSPLRVILVDDHEDFLTWARTLLSAMQTSGYFRIDRHVGSEQELENLLAHGEIQFAVTIPPDFSRRVGSVFDAPRLLMRSMTGAGVRTAFGRNSVRSNW